MRRRPQEPDSLAVAFKKTTFNRGGKLGLVLSGGGARAAYQAGALRALVPYLDKRANPFSVLVGSSIGAINCLVLGATVKLGFERAVEVIEDLWQERTWRNTFGGSPSVAFFRAVRMASVQYFAPGPNATESAIFDPSPLMKRIDEVIDAHGGLAPENRDARLEAVAVMTTVEGLQRRPLLFASTHKRVDSSVLDGASFEICYRDSLHSKHGFASAALPSVLPPVEIDTGDGSVRLVDGGISQNIPIDPAVRLGAERVIMVDISGRNWWLDRAGESHDTRPSWEVPAGYQTYCIRPPETFVLRAQKPLGPILREAVSSSSSKFIKALGPIWPVFTLLRKKAGEEVAYEAMSYVALDPDYVQGLIQRGFDETKAVLKGKSEIEFTVELNKHAPADDSAPPPFVESLR